MAVTAGEYKSFIGLDKLYYATITEDCSSAYTAGTPAILAPAAELSAEPNQASEVQYADDAPFDVFYARGEIKLTIRVTAIPLETLATITGLHYDTTNGLLYDDGGTPPDCAFLFRSMKSNGIDYRYYAYLKGKFQIPTEEAATKGDTPDPKTQELVFTAIKTTYQWGLANDTTDGVIRLIGDTDITAFSGASWYTAVPVPVFTS